MSEGLMLAARLALSLAAVIGLMWLAARVVRGSARGRRGDVLEVLARQPVGRGSAVVLLRVAGQALVVGVTESRVTLLGETDLAAVQDASDAAGATGPTGRVGATAAPAGRLPRTTSSARPAGSAASGAAGGLHGSVLSPSTWRQAADALRERTVRKG